MQTTLTLDDDVVALAKEFATAHALSLDAAVSELARRGAHKEPRLIRKNGLLVVARTPGAPFISTEAVKKALEEES